jgi:hypothetical protein
VVSQSATVDDAGLLTRKDGSAVVSLTTSPVRVDSDVLEAAKAAGAVLSRSASQQVSYWARLGKQVEAANGINHNTIARVLAGQEHYDNLGELDQAAVRVAWDESIEEAIGGLNYEDQLLDDGESWAEADEQGDLVIRNAE